jgi:hypothetical protein
MFGHCLTAAVDTGHPIVFQILQGMGLDIGRLCDGYKRSQQFLNATTGARFGDNFDRVFCNPAKTALTPTDNVE